MTVWAALNDPLILQASIPGCTSLSGNTRDGFEAVVTQKIGPVKATFKGAVAISDIVEGHSYTISGQGKAGPAGYAHGSALVTLEDANNGTTLGYEVTAKVGGKIASLGGRLIDGLAKQLAEQFFEKFQNAVETEDKADQDVIESADTGIMKKMLNWLKRLFG